MNNATQSFLGRYRLVKILGQGAMGVVYEAVDTRLARTVALKTVLLSHLADESNAGEYASRFEREAQAAARLAHPNIVTVHDFGEHEDISYIVMEFVRGRELASMFEAGQALPLPEILRIMRELLAALDYAHEQGIVHRDVKPANVMLDHAGHVKLADFGVARVANTTQDRTMPGTLVGTPSYMAPEQVLGLAVGSRADIFAAGVILYQGLTGKRPFVGTGPFEVQRKIVQEDPPPPSRVAPQLPAALDHVIARALAKHPEDRYPTAAAFAAALEAVGAIEAQTPPSPAAVAVTPAPGAAATHAAAAATAVTAAPAVGAARPQTRRASEAPPPPSRGQMRQATPAAAQRPSLWPLQTRLRRGPNPRCARSRCHPLHRPPRRSRSPSRRARTRAARRQPHQAPRQRRASAASGRKHSARAAATCCSGCRSASR